MQIAEVYPSDEFALWRCRMLLWAFPLRSPGVARPLDITRRTDMAEQTPERLPGTVVLMPTRAQLAEHELAGVERGDRVQCWRLWLLWLS